ncbi:hypothetical protein IRJ41_007473 [Triplophysa rosa]|uniref:Uncharacterized protein n=1 Tax=Triplophysa rosa TaxID=992332 RepID=A0A9W7WYL1_TRIRA|nr:hypothetical protein IRJ41_007473 [Triplophysa rosa]
MMRRGDDERRDDEERRGGTGREKRDEERRGEKGGEGRGEERRGEEIERGMDKVGEKERNRRGRFYERTPDWTLENPGAPIRSLKAQGTQYENLVMSRCLMRNAVFGRHKHFLPCGRLCVGLLRYAI